MVVLGRFQYRISSSEHLYPDMHMKSDESNQKSWFLHVLFNLSHNIEVFFVNYHIIQKRSLCFILASRLM